MTTRYDGLLSWDRKRVSHPLDVAAARALADRFDGREPVLIPSPPAKGEAGLLFGLLTLCLVWTLLAVVGAVWIGCWLWPDRVVIGRLVFWLTIAGLMGVAARVVVSELGKGRR